MIFHENRLLAEDSHEISNIIFSKIRTSVFGALKLKICQQSINFDNVFFISKFLMIIARQGAIFMGQIDAPPPPHTHKKQKK